MNDKPQTNLASIKGLASVKTALALVQTAYAMSLDGQLRATAGEISSKARNDLNLEITPSATGQYFSELGITTVNSHGKKRFVLDASELEPIKAQLITVCHELTDKLETSLREYQGLADTINGLEERLKENYRLKAREKELARQIKENQPDMKRLPYLEQEAERLRESANEAISLEKECRLLEKKLNSLPSLEKRKAALKEALEDYQADFYGIQSREAGLAREIEKLQKRKGWLELAELNEEIKQLSVQLGEKRSLADKLFGRNRS